MNTNRDNYQVSTILAEGYELSCDQMQTRLNANCLVMGPSGSGKTRDFLKPNLLQMGSSFVVLDTKGNLRREVGPVLEAHGYEIWHLDFANGLKGTVGYDPIRYLKYDLVDNKGTFCPNELSALSLASSICPNEDYHEPFWGHCAQRIIASLIMLAAEQSPRGCASFADVIRLYQGTFGDSSSPRSTDTAKAFRRHAERHPESRAVAMWNRALAVGAAEKTWGSIMGFVENALQLFASRDAIEMYERANQIDFHALAQKHVAMFITISDIDISMAPMTSTFIMQAFEQLEAFADSREDSCLPVPVRFFLDDFANLRIPNIAQVLSVSRSREIWITLLLQSVMQLNSNYGVPDATSIISNCDTQLLLGFCDLNTASYYTDRANKRTSTLFNVGPDEVWLFIRTKPAKNLKRYSLENHPLYGELPEAKTKSKAGKKRAIRAKKAA